MLLDGVGDVLLNGVGHGDVLHNGEYLLVVGDGGRVNDRGGFVGMGDGQSRGRGVVVAVAHVIVSVAQTEQTSLGLLLDQGLGLLFGGLLLSPGRRHDEGDKGHIPHLNKQIELWLKTQHFF